ncbi:MAG: GerW family sporulation protein [Oscillospiraceae bacterium]|nr:GerW family sporulation protein [Oscillospiraceae bacterium]
MAHPVEGVMGVSMEKIREMVDVETIIGDPITAEGVTIIPVSKVSFGFASGGSDLPTQAAEKFAGGSGAGVTVKPVAFIVIKPDGNVSLMELGAKGSPFDGVMDALPGIVEKIKGFMAEKKAAKAEKKAQKDAENTAEGETLSEEKPE